MKTITYRKAMTAARRYIKALNSTPKEAPNWAALAEGALRWRAMAVRLAHSDTEKAKAAAL